MAKKILLAMGLVFMMTLASFSGWAEVPGLINYQGKLTDKDGNPLTNRYEMNFLIYTTLTGGTAEWSETQDVTVKAGIYSVELGDTIPLPATLFAENDELYLEVQVKEPLATTWDTLEPRQRITSTAFAMKAAVADSVVDGAVTTVMISDSAITSGKVATNAITSEKIEDGTVTAADILDGPDSGLDADTLDGFSAGAFAASGHVHDHGSLSGLADDDHPQYLNLSEDETIVGIPAFNGGTSGSTAPFSVDSDTLVTNLNADRLDGIDSTGFQKKHLRVAIVALDNNGDYTDPATAMEGEEVSKWCGTPNDSAPCLLKIMPGFYDVGTKKVVMRPWVDIEGSGENVTFIQGAVEGEYAGLVEGANYAEIRFLTVKNVNDVEQTNAIFNSGTSPKLTHVTAIATGGNVSRGIFNYQASPVMTDVTIPMTLGNSAVAVYNLQSSPMMTNVTATATGTQSSTGVFNHESPAVMKSVKATAAGGTLVWAIWNVNSSPVMTNVTATATGAQDSYGVYNQYSPAEMRNVVATATGGIRAHAIINTESSVVMMNVTATASDAIGNVGVRYKNGPVPSAQVLMRNVIVSASGGEENYGFLIDGGSAVLISVTAKATGGTKAFGVLSSGGANSLLRNVIATATGGSDENYGVYNTTGASIKIVSSSVLAAASNGLAVLNESSGGVVTIDNSTIQGSRYASNLTEDPNLFRIGASKLDYMEPTYDQPYMTCAGVYDKDYTFFPATCPGFPSGASI